MKKVIVTSAAVLFSGLTLLTISLIFTPSCSSKATGVSEKSDPSYTNKKWYTNEYIPDNAVPQNLTYQVYGRYSRPVKKGKLNEAKVLSDFIPGYPVNWITNYVSVEISATCNGKAMKAVSENDSLSAEQKSILNTADLASDIVVNVKHMYRNPITNYIEDNGVYVSMTVIPEIEAEYVGGYPQMAKYLKENIIDIISKKTPKEFQQGKVLFTVSEQGEIVNAKMAETSGDPKTDKLFLEGINKMPKWRPAENAKGIKVKQEFVFSVGRGGC